MSISYFVRYHIAAPDLPAFLERYRTIHTPVDWRDPFPVNRGKAVLLAQLEFETEEAMNHAFASRERALARKDFEELWRSAWLDGNEEQA